MRRIAGLCLMIATRWMSMTSSAQPQATPAGRVSAAQQAPFPWRWIFAQTGIQRHFCLSCYNIMSVMS
jgi:hypothetical protein